MMKNLLALMSILFVQFTHVIHAQTIILGKEIDEKKLASSARLANYKMNTKLKYVQQSRFSLNNDLSISLFDGQILHAKYITQKQNGLSTPTYQYKIEGDEEGLVFFTDYENWLDGFIVMGTGERFHITKTADQIYSVSKINNDYYKDEERSIDTFEEKSNFLDKNRPSHPSVCTSSPCPNSVVDIMVLFSNQTIADVNGGTPAAISATLTQVGVLNQSLQDSGINNLTFNLIHAQAIDHNDMTDLDDDMGAIKTGYLSTYVSGLRNQYGADLVSIFCNHGTGVGSNNLNPTSFNSNSAYSAINYNYVMNNYSLSHELGHNMGMRHEWYLYQDDLDYGAKPCEHHHGYSNKVAIEQGTASAQNKRWRTIMSYGNECEAVGISCPRLNRWSNPSLMYNGDAMGVPIGSFQPSDERYALMRTGCIVAGFRTAPASVLNTQNTQEVSNVFSYYPNPAKNKLFLSKEIKGYNIYNVEGRYINGSNEKAKEINILYLPKGVYIINTTLFDNTKYSFKFIKE